MNDEKFELTISDLAGSGTYYADIADELRARDTAQREALARVEAERDQWQTAYWKQHRITGEAQTQLAEALRLLQTVANTLGRPVPYPHIKAFLARHAQAEQQEAPKRGKPYWNSHRYDQIFQTSERMIMVPEELVERAFRQLLQPWCAGHERTASELRSLVDPGYAAPVAASKLKTGVVQVVNTDCRTEEGVTVGIVDAFITLARLLKGREQTEQVRSALDDLREDEDVANLFTSPADAHWDRMPVETGALASTIEVLDQYLNGDCSGPLTQDQGESVMLVIHELKRLMAAAHGDEAVLWELLEALRTATDRQALPGEFIRVMWEAGCDWINTRATMRAQGAGESA